MSEVSVPTPPYPPFTGGEKIGCNAGCRPSTPEAGGSRPPLLSSKYLALSAPGQGASFALILVLLFAGSTPAEAQTPEPAPPAASLLPGATEGFVDSSGVKIHYVSLGNKKKIRCSS